MPPTTSATGALKAPSACGRYCAHQGSASSGSSVNTVRPMRLKLSIAGSSDMPASHNATPSAAMIAPARWTAAPRDATRRPRPAGNRQVAPGRTPPAISRLAVVHPAMTASTGWSSSSLQPVERRASRASRLCMKRFGGCVDSHANSRARHAHLGHRAPRASRVQRTARAASTRAARRRRSRAGSRSPCRRTRAAGWHSSRPGSRPRRTAPRAPPTATAPDVADLRGSASMASQLSRTTACASAV